MLRYGTGNWRRGYSGWRRSILKHTGGRNACLRLNGMIFSGGICLTAGGPAGQPRAPRLPPASVRPATGTGPVRQRPTGQDRTADTIRCPDCAVPGHRPGSARAVDTVLTGWGSLYQFRFESARPVQSDLTVSTVCLYARARARGIGDGAVAKT